MVITTKEDKEVSHKTPKDQDSESHLKVAEESIRLTHFDHQQKQVEVFDPSKSEEGSKKQTVEVQDHLTTGASPKSLIVSRPYTGPVTRARARALSLQSPEAIPLQRNKSDCQEQLITQFQGLYINEESESFENMPVMVTGTTSANEQLLDMQRKLAEREAEVAVLTPQLAAKVIIDSEKKDEERKEEEFVQSLKGSAFTWYTQLPPGSILTWDDMQKVFLAQFVNSNLQCRCVITISCQKLQRLSQQRSLNHLMKLVSKASNVEIQIARQKTTTKIQIGEKKNEGKKTFKNGESMATFVKMDKKNDRGKGKEETRRLTLNERKEVKYTFDDEDVETILYELLVAMAIKLPKPKRPAKVDKTNDSKYCSKSSSFKDTSYDWNECTTIVSIHADDSGFQSSRTKAMGTIALQMEIGELYSDALFHVIDADTSYNVLLGRPWLHTYGIVPSTLHQCFKFLSNGEVKRVSADADPFGGEEVNYSDAKFYKSPSLTFVQPQNIEKARHELSIKTGGASGSTKPIKIKITTPSVVFPNKEKTSR
ncbi:hypothetical protein L3X38_036923 [Prunus dulcis]|uniref:Retrotransposon gag domain-containing protein n=1 Tax=Prunus dulcis TaxID=3755 RepID=A0AAD4V3M0_PRUDU|nr:hypothetical protein L3X38_036923 [Prunus dulcis]